jgi:hypothetical protein
MIVEPTNDAKYVPCVKCGEQTIKTKSCICLKCFDK